MSTEDEEAAETLWRELEGQRAHLDEECKGDVVQQEAKWCLDTLSKVVDAKANKNGIYTQSRRWWNGKVKEMRSAVEREKRLGRRAEAAAHAKPELQSSIQQSKSHKWNDYLLNLRWGEVWRAAKHTNTRVGATVEALTDRVGN